MFSEKFYLLVSIIYKKKLSLWTYEAFIQLKKAQNIINIIPMHVKFSYVMYLFSFRTNKFCEAFNNMNKMITFKFLEN